MNGAASPLGKFSELTAAVTATLLVVAAVAVHTGLIPAVDTAWLDTSAGLAIGVILGQRATTNGAAKIAQAAHERIDTVERAVGIDTHPHKSDG